MELTVLNVALMGAAGSLIGVAVSALINWMIAKDNRAKSLNEWRREKLLALVYEFLHEYKECTSRNNRNTGQYDTSIITEMALKNYHPCDQKAYQICLFMPENKSKDFIGKYNAMKLEAAKQTDKMHHDLMTGNHYDYFSTADDYSQLNDVIALLSGVIKKMK